MAVAAMVFAIRRMGEFGRCALPIVILAKPIWRSHSRNLASADSRKRQHPMSGKGQTRTKANAKYLTNAPKRP